MIHITGKVMRGEGYGRVLGFPTANIDRRDFSRRKLKIKFGIWAGVAEALGLHESVNIKAGQGPALRGKKYKAAIVIGPLDSRGLPKIEAHLLNFKGNLYGKYLSIYLGIYLRPFKKFKSEAELKKQISRDVSVISNINLPVGGPISNI